MTDPRRDQRGLAAIEFIGALPVVMICALFAWQLLLGAFSATAAQDAARTGSRVESMGGNGAVAARGAVSSWLQDDVTATTDPGSTRVHVTIRVPIVLPGVSSGAFTVSRAAELPRG